MNRYYSRRTSHILIFNGSSNCESIHRWDFWFFHKGNKQTHERFWDYILNFCFTSINSCSFILTYNWWWKGFTLFFLNFSRNDLFSFGNVLATVALLPLQLKHDLMIALHSLKLCVWEEQLDIQYIHYLLDKH